MRRESAFALLAALLSGCASLSGGSQTDGPKDGIATDASAGVRQTSPQRTAPVGQSASIEMTKVPKGNIRLTTVGDLSCPQLVAPYELTSNLKMLQELGVEGLWQTLRLGIDMVVKGTSADLAGKQVAKNAKHSIPYHLRAAAFQMNWIPMELEVAYGEELLRQFDKAGTVQPRAGKAALQLYDTAEALLAQALAAVSEPHGYQFKVVVTTRSGSNAEALPGGIILIDPALLDKKQARAARFSMAHEVGHVLQRHQTRNMQARIIDAVSLRGSLADLGKVMGEAKGDPKAVIPLILVGKLQFEKFFVEQELHADGCGVRILNNSEKSTVELTAVIQEFLVQLPKAVVAGTAEPTIKPPVDAIKAASRDANAMLDLVTRPIERHPTPKERRDNLSSTVKKIREETPDAGRAKGRQPSAAGASL